MTNGTCGCACPHHKVVPVLVILFGLSFLLASMQVITVGLLQIVWPIIIILIGLNQLMTGVCKCCSK